MPLTHYDEYTTVGPNTGTTTDTFASAATLTPSPRGHIYRSATIFIRNTHASNGLDYEVRGYAFPGSVRYRIIKNGPLPATGQNLHEIEIARSYGFIDVLVRASSAGAQATYGIEMVGGR